MPSITQLGRWSVMLASKKSQRNERSPWGMAAKNLLYRLAQCCAATAVAVILAGLASPSVQAQTVQGIATYRERIALPPDAAFEATIEDVSRADMPAEVIGRVRIEPAGQVPIRFEISYAAARIDPKHRYSVRARIARGDALLFTTTQAYLVLTQGAGTEVELLLQRANRPSPKPDRALTETYWKLVQLGDRAVQVAPNQREPHLILRTTGNRVGGSGGCNRIMGSFTLDGPTLSFGQMAATQMACLEGMEQESAFLQALDKVKGWQAHGDELKLLDERGGMVAQFVAVDLK